MDQNEMDELGAILPNGTYLTNEEVELWTEALAEALDARYDELRI